MKKIIFTLSSILTFTAAFAQAPSFAWAKQSTDAHLSGIGSVAVDTVHHFVYATGSSGGNMDFGAGDLYADGTQNVYLAKYNLNGGLIWVKYFSSDYETYASGIAIDNSGNLFVTGYSQNDTLRFGSQYILNSHSGSTDHTVGYLAKFDANGNTLWIRGNIGGGGIGCQSVAVDASGNAYITGYEVDAEGTFGGFPITTGGAFFMKFNSGGTAQWLTEASGAGTLLSSTGYAIAVDNSGGCVAAGVYSGAYANFGSINVVNGNGLYQNWRFTTKLNTTTGAFIWAIGDGIWQAPCANYGISVDNANNIYLSGHMAVATEGPGSSASDGRQFAEKLNPAGVSQWIDMFPVFLSSTCIATDPAGNSFVTMGIMDTVTYGAYTITPNLPYGQGTAQVIAIVKLDNAGNVVFAKASENPGIICLAQPFGIALDEADHAYVAGDIEYACKFDSTTVTSGSGLDFVLAKLGGNSISGIKEITESNFSIYPNPATAVLNIHYKGNEHSAVIVTILDLMGRVVLSQKLNTASATQLDVSQLTKGMYTITLQNENGERSSQRFVMQ